MTEENFHDIERLLRQMRPAEPNPAIKSHLTRTLDQATDAAILRAPVRRHVRLPLVVAAVMALAWMVVVMTWSDPPSSPPVAHTEPPPPRHPSPIRQPRRTGPTLLALNTALRHSPDEAELMLAQIGKDLLARHPRKTEPAMMMIDSGAFSRHAYDKDRP